MQFRDETGMSTEPTTRYIKAFGKTPDHWFANNWRDTDGSTLVHEDCFFVPIREQKSDGTFASKPIISTFSPQFVPALELDDALKCYLQPTATSSWNDHTRAARWTLRSMWEDAFKDYAVLSSTGNGMWIKEKSFAGILDLSAEYGTNNWDDGAIGSSGTRIYRINQLITNAEGDEFFHPLKNDPRLAPDELPTEYLGRLVLPQ